MIHKLNIQNCRMGILTYKNNGKTMDSTMIFPSDVPIKEGDAIAHPIWFKQIENMAQLLRIDKIHEQRLSGGDWKTQPPLWYKVSFSRQNYSKDQLGDIIKVSTVEENGKQTERFTL